jgi:hypothetical protein
MRWQVRSARSPTLGLEQCRAGDKNSYAAFFAFCARNFAHLALVAAATLSTPHRSRRAGRLAPAIAPYLFIHIHRANLLTS